MTTLPAGVTVSSNPALGVTNVTPGPVAVGSGPIGPIGPAGPSGILATLRGSYNSLTTYTAGPPPDAVIGSNGHWYVSLTNGNVGHDPTTDGGVHWADQLPSSVENAISAVAYLAPSGGDDAAALAALLPANAGAGLTIKLQAGKVYNWGSVVRLPYGLTSWLVIDTNNAIINFASGVARAFDLYDGTNTARTYQYIWIKGEGSWTWNNATSLPAGNQHILLGNLIAGSQVGQANFAHIYCEDQTFSGVPAQASPSLQFVSLWITNPSGTADDIEINSNKFSGGCVPWFVGAASANQTASVGIVKASDNRWDSGVTPTTQNGAFGSQVGGYATVEYYEATGNRIANSWDTGFEADNCQRALLEGNETVDCYNDHVLFRNIVPPTNLQAQQYELRGHLFRNVNYDPSGTNGASNHVLLGNSPAASNGTGTTASGTNSITAATGTWQRGQTIIGAGVPLGSTVLAVSGIAGNLTLTISQKATASASGVALSFQDFQIGSVILEGNESSFESAVADTGARSGLVVQARYANLLSLKIRDHKIGFGPNFAYNPATPGSHLVLIDASPISALAEIDIRGVSATFAGAPTNAANFIELVRLNPVHAVVKVDELMLDITAITAASISSMSWLGVTIGYQLTGYPNASAKLHGAIERVKVMNPLLSSGLFGIFGSTSVVVSGTFLRVRKCDFSQWGSSSGSDYTINSGDYGRFFVEAPAGSRSTGSTPLLQAQATITPGVSPYTYTNQDYIEEEVVVNGGTVSALTKTPFGGSAITENTSGVFRLRPGDAVTVTYTVAPTMTKYPTG